MRKGAGEMSEVSDAVQVIMVCGRGSMLLGNITTKAALQVIKVLNTIYLSKWKGSVSLNRLRQIKGEDLVFINVSSERRDDLLAVEKEMKAHGILFARMPDLCGGDSRTQYAIASQDAMKMSAMLLDHNEGPYRHIRVGPISESDYVMTGKRADGRDTKEMQEIIQGVKEKKPSGQSHVDKTAPKRPAEQRLRVSPSSDQLPTALKDIRIRFRDKQIEGGEDAAYWLKDKPILETDQYAQFMMPDHKHSIFILQEDIVPGRDEKSGYRMAAIFRDQMYSMLNLDKMNATLVDGMKAIAMLKLSGGIGAANTNEKMDRTIRERGQIRENGVIPSSEVRKYL